MSPALRMLLHRGTEVCHRRNPGPLTAFIARVSTITLRISCFEGSYATRAAWIQQEYLKLLWNDKINFFAVYKENLQGNGKYTCQPAARDDFFSSTSTGDKIPVDSTFLTGGHLPDCPPKWTCNKTVGVRPRVCLPFRIPAPSVLIQL